MKKTVLFYLVLSMSIALSSCDKKLNNMHSYTPNFGSMSAQ